MHLPKTAEAEGLGADGNLTSEEHSCVKTRNIVFALAAALCLTGLYFLSRYNYLLFHSLSEVFAISIIFAIFAIAWNSRRIMDNDYLLFLGIAFLFVGGLDLLHTIAYKGMGVLTETSANPATQLWIAMRYMTAFSLLAGSLFFVRRKIRPIYVFAVYSAATVLLLGSIFYWENFPQAYVDGVGLTMFKILSEYAISLILLCSILLLVVKRREFSGDVFKYLVSALGVAIATELAFTLYTDVYGISNMIGHLLNVVSFYLIYKALVETGITKPYALLFRNLKLNEINLEKNTDELTKMNDQLLQEATERKKAQQALQESEEQLRLKLDSVLSPNMEISEQDLSNVIDVKALQSTMDDLFAVTKIGFALIDLKGNVLVGTGWQDVCTKFHRVNPETLKNCIESDIELSSGIKKGEIRLYKCKNNIWDVVTPLVMGGKHVGNVFFGQFFFEDEIVNRNMFALQAEKYGFDKDAYLSAFDRVPRFRKEKIENVMMFYAKLSELISKLSYGNLKLAKSLSHEKVLQDELEQYSRHLETIVDEKTKQLRDQERLAAIGQTAGMVGHDIRNPLQAITSELYLERSEISSLPDGETKKNLQESISGIEENLFYINKIIADLQDYARPLSPKKEEVNVEAAVKDALAIVTIPEHVKVHVMGGAVIPSLIADSTMLKRVLVNLIQNAVQAMPNGGNLTVSAIDNGNQVCINIEDTGEGIHEDAKSKLFTPLFTTKSKGQGFGLAVVKRLVDAQGGTIAFESEQGKGTKFMVQFPK
jgi:signal transduction histidine kinase/PAS domain-containing protein